MSIHWLSVCNHWQIGVQGLCLALDWLLVIFAQMNKSSLKVYKMLHLLSLMNQMTMMRERRDRLAEQMGPNSIAIISTSPEVMRNRDADYKFRADSSFFYLTGFAEPQAVAVIETDETACSVVNVIVRWKSGMVTVPELMVRLMIMKQMKLMRLICLTKKLLLKF
ncbi:unnamed protein product [Oppiella nova]|uniref:Aminopeptidase P N-terminal domain-containing protein n=1 Tax=Oppiella nova TaxID=334625 RepID=A0A7R9L8Y9_9ACAR|nr:unnamed protein product [Oppiella nova]CAG2160139.1 unnamed protein product [Oppiella nova]